MRRRSLVIALETRGSVLNRYRDSPLAHLHRRKAYRRKAYRRFVRGVGVQQPLPHPPKQGVLVSAVARHEACSTQFTVRTEAGQRNSGRGGASQRLVGVSGGCGLTADTTMIPVFSPGGQASAAASMAREAASWL